MQSNRKLWKYPHLRCTLVIAIITFIMLILSLLVSSAPWNSIIQNVFAGLITGLVITLIGSLKSKSIKDAETEQKFLQSICDRYKMTSKLWIEYRKKRHADVDEFFETVYEFAAEMESIESYVGYNDKNQRLLRILGKKPSVLFEEETNYHYGEQTQRHKELYNILNSEAEQNDQWRKAIDDKINEIRRAHRELNRIAGNLIRDLDEQRVEIETSVP